jgi:hypothetical protein
MRVGLGAFNRTANTSWSEGMSGNNATIKVVRYYSIKPANDGITGSKVFGR